MEALARSFTGLASRDALGASEVAGARVWPAAAPGTTAATGIISGNFVSWDGPFSKGFQKLGSVPVQQAHHEQTEGMSEWNEDDKAGLGEVEGGW